MNTIALRRTAAWTLAALLAIIAGVGEGLHFIPGLGHGVMVGERVLVLGEVPDKPRIGLDAEPCCACTHGGQSVPIVEEDDCPICQIIGASFAPDAAAAMPALAVVAEHFLAAPAVAAVPAPAVYHARAPPQG